jgi:trehalose 6-phosphate phosphatase
MTAPQGAPAAVPTPQSAAGREGLAALLRAPATGLIALDFDGTLAPIVADPDAARADPAAVAALHRLGPLTGTLAVITGRPALSAVEYAGLESVPGIIVLGHYGRQRWQAGELTTQPEPPGLAAAREQLPGVLAAAGAPDGTWTEDKGEALAVHTRRTAEPDRALERLRGPLAALAERTDLTVEPGRLVIELRPAGSDKGLALKNLASKRSPSATLFCGDDLGDRPAFRAVAELRAAGTPGVTVFAGSAEVSVLADEADLVVDGPAGVVALLNALAAAFAAA